MFHVALLALLSAIAFGSLYGFKGTVIVREGSSFADSQSELDSYTPGKAFDASSLPPFAFTLDKFTADYQRGGQQNGAARDFSADVTLTPSPGASPEKHTVQVNEPLDVDGVKVFLVGHGYAPTITIKDAKGQVVFHDSVVFLPQDGNFTSTGVVKVPDTVPQLGLSGFFLPSAATDPVIGPHSTCLRKSSNASAWQPGVPRYTSEIQAVRTRIVPSLGSIRRITQRAVVDLPQPDSPTRPRVSPSCRVKLTPSTAWTRATSRSTMMPDLMGKCTTRSVTSSSGSPFIGSPAFPPV